MKKYLISLILVGATTLACATELETFGNTVGIEEGDVCMVEQVGTAGEQSTITITCSPSGKKFENVRTIKNYAVTGTPPSITYPTSYIGNVKTKKGTRMPGSGKMTVYLKE